MESALQIITAILVDDVLVLALVKPLRLLLLLLPGALVYMVVLPVLVMICNVVLMANVESVALIMEKCCRGPVPALIVRVGSQQVI